MRSGTQPGRTAMEKYGRTTYNGGVLISLLQKALENTNESAIAVAIVHTRQNHRGDKQVAQLSQRDRAVGRVSYGQKWKTNWETIFYGHCRSIFNQVSP